VALLELETMEFLIHDSRPFESDQWFTTIWTQAAEERKKFEEEAELLRSEAKRMSQLLEANKAQEVGIDHCVWRHF